MMKSMNQKAEGSKAAGSAKCGAQSSNNKKAAPVFVFENPEFGMVRTATDEKGELWFCAKDLCDALGYKRADLAVKQHVNPHDAAKRCVWVEVGKKKDGTPAKRLTQMIFVNESGFYALVLGSKLPSALMFKDWVTSVVLPQIRKTGGYIPVNEGGERGGDDSQCRTDSPCYPEGKGKPAGETEEAAGGAEIKTA